MDPTGGILTGRWTFLALVTVFFGAAAMRLAPLLDFSLWGSDWGEYYVLSDTLVSSGAHPTENLGWGGAYPDFPGLFDLAGGIALVLGVSVHQAIALVVPCVTALSCLVVACLALRLGGGPWVALVSAGFLAFVFPEVFQNSHPVPGPLGSVLLLAMLLLFLVGDSWRRDTGEDRPRPLTLHLLMLLLVLALAVCHHMSLFFALIGVLLAHMVRAVLVRGVEPEREAWGAWTVLAVLGVATVYWLFLAPNFRADVMVDLLGMPGWSLMVAAWAGVVVLLLVARRLSRWSLDEERGRLRPLNPPFSSPSELRVLFCAFVACGLVIMTMVALMGFPGTEISTDIVMLPYFAPLLIAFAMGVGSTDIILRRHGGHAPVAWIAAIIVSFLVAIGMESQVLISYRHLPYVVELTAILVGFGAVHLRDMTLPRGRTWSRGFGTLCALLFAAMVVTALPPKEIMGGFQEGTTEEELSAVLWLRGGLPGGGADPTSLDGGTVAADHRLSSMAFGIGGQMATWDTSGKVLHEPLDDGAGRALGGVETPVGRRPVAAVLVSEDTREGAALYQWEAARPIEGEAWDKFFYPPFLRVYDGGTVWVMAVDSGGIADGQR